MPSACCCVLPSMAHLPGCKMHHVLDSSSVMRHSLSAKPDPASYMPAHYATARTLVASAPRSSCKGQVLRACSPDRAPWVQVSTPCRFAAPLAAPAHPVCCAAPSSRGSSTMRVTFRYTRIAPTACMAALVRTA